MNLKGDVDGYYKPKGRELWKILIGNAQIKMNWVITSQELNEKLWLKIRRYEKRR